MWKVPAGPRDTHQECLLENCPRPKLKNHKIGKTTRLFRGRKTLKRALLPQTKRNLEDANGSPELENLSRSLQTKLENRSDRTERKKVKTNFKLYPTKDEMGEDLDLYNKERILPSSHLST